jgi:formate hydrogenlyase transcriptional activator
MTAPAPELPHCAGHQGRRESIIEEAIATLLGTSDVKLVLDRTAKLLRRNFGATRVTIHRLPADDATVAEILLADDPRGAGPAPGTRLPLAGSLCGATVAARAPRVLSELSPEGGRALEEAELARSGYGSLACFPLRVEERVIGTLSIAHPPVCGMFEHCLRAAEGVARLIAIALHWSLLLDEVRRLNDLLDRENALLKDQIREARPSLPYVAESPLMRELLARIELVAPSDSTVLIRGETGTGKEGLARLVHDLSRRASGPFVVVNLGAIPETLVESELFGYEKGAFTGATRRRLGRFEQASGGTLFLDEVGDAPPSLQVKLLRALQERMIERVGGEGPVPVDVRVVAATNRSLERMLDEGSFRSDLYYRLSTFPVHLPPLRERRADIRPLVLHLLERHAAKMHRRPPRVAEATLAALERHDWPGNVRELENTLERALILSPGPALVLEELPGRPRVRPASPRVPADGAPGRFDEEMRALLARALEACGGKIYGESGAAALLGLRPTTLQGKLRRFKVRRGG